MDSQQPPAVESICDEFREHVQGLITDFGNSVGSAIEELKQKLLQYENTLRQEREVATTSRIIIPVALDPTRLTVFVKE